jgi:flagellar hook-associated protein 3 FlgL
MSIYRVATANTFDRTIQNINRRQSELAQAQEQLSSGKRINRASDDAVAATLAERAQNRLARVQADQTALEASKSSLTLVEAGLGEANDLLVRARELVVQGGNPVLTQNSREDLARQLEGLREQMLEVANRTDTAGMTLFGGLGGAAKPFLDIYGPFTGVQYEGQIGQYAATETGLPQAVDGNAVWMRVPPGNGTFTVALDPGNQGLVRTDPGEVADPQDLQLAIDSRGIVGYRITFSGTREAPQFTVERELSAGGYEQAPPFFAPADYQPGTTIEFDGIRLQLSGDPMGKGDPTVPQLPGDPVPPDEIRLQLESQPTDLFATFQRAIDALRYQGANQPANITQELDRVLVEMDSGTDRILDTRGRVGEWLNRADSMGDQFADKALFHQKEKSDNEDLDMVKGISDFQNLQIGLQAALQSYGQVQKLSLFQYIA